MNSAVGFLECEQDIENLLEGGKISRDFYSNDSQNDDLESEFKKNS
jgi:hypothetical protein